MSTTNDLGAAIGKIAYDSDGGKIGKIGQVYLNDQSGQPEWITVSTGMFGSRASFAPLHGSSMDGNNLRLAVSKQLVKDAPNVNDDGHMEDAEADALYSHYRGHLSTDTAGQSDTEYASDRHTELETGQSDTEYASDRHTELETGQGQHAGTSREDLTGQPGIQGRDVSGPTTDNAMTRSEERLHIGTENVRTGRARLRKYIVEEQVSTTVPISHEEVRIEREPITAADMGDAMSGSELSEEEHEITLHAERPIVSKETIPVERVKLATETVTENAQVHETARKEQIDQVEGIDIDGTSRH